jgi:hypothetical protein
MYIVPWNIERSLYESPEASVHHALFSPCFGFFPHLLLPILERLA